MRAASLAAGQLLRGTGAACSLLHAPIMLVCGASSLAGAGALHAGTSGMRSALSRSAGAGRPSFSLSGTSTGSKLVALKAARRDLSGVASVAAAWAASRQLRRAGLLMVNTSRSFASALQLQRDCECA